jgi:hypothetical protein
VGTERAGLGHGSSTILGLGWGHECGLVGACWVPSGGGALARGGATADAATLRLDGRFGDGGIAHVRFGSGQTGTGMSARRPVRQPNGKVLVAAAAEIEHWNSQVRCPFAPA